MYCTVQYMQALVIFIHFYDELSSDSSHIVLNKKISLINVSILFYINFMFTPQTHTTRIVWLVKTFVCFVWKYCPCGGRDGPKNLLTRKLLSTWRIVCKNEQCRTCQHFFAKKVAFCEKSSMNILVSTVQYSVVGCYNENFYLISNY